MTNDEMTKLGLVSRELLQSDERRRKDNLAMLRNQPGSRPDGTMQPTALPEGARRGHADLLGAGSAGADPVEQVRNYVGDARRIIDNFEKSTIELESKVAQLSAQLDGERAARQSLEKMITEISRLVAPQ